MRGVFNYDLISHGADPHFEIYNSNACNEAAMSVTTLRGALSKQEARITAIERESAHSQCQECSRVHQKLDFKASEAVHTT